MSRRRRAPDVDAIGFVDRVRGRGGPKPGPALHGVLELVETRMNPCTPALLKGKASVLPPPGETTWLGYCLVLEHEMPDGDLVRHAWEPGAAPDCWWKPIDGIYGAIYVFPGLTFDPGAARGLGNPQKYAEAAAAYKRWTGQAATGTAKLQVPKVNVRRAGRAASILYRSDKWGDTPGDWTNYIHPFEDGVVADLAPGRPPAALYVHGGQLRLTERGLEG